MREILPKQIILRTGLILALNGGLAGCVQATEEPTQTPQPTGETTLLFPTLTPIPTEEQILFVSPTSILPSPTAKPTLQETPTSTATLVSPTETPTLQATKTPTPTETPLSLADVVKEGDYLYVVQSGDTLSKIAQEYGVSLDSLTAANPHLEDINILSVGQAVIIPGQEGLVNAIGGEETATPELPTPTVFVQPTPTVEPTSTPIVETPTPDPEKPYLNQPLEYFDKLVNRELPTGQEAGSNFPGFSKDSGFRFYAYNHEFGWTKETDDLIRYAVLAFTKDGQLIGVMVEGESNARNFSIPIPNFDEIPNISFYFAIAYDSEWIPVTIGKWG